MVYKLENSTFQTFKTFSVYETVMIVNYSPNTFINILYYLLSARIELREEGNVLFNDALNTFYL